MLPTGGRLIGAIHPDASGARLPFPCRAAPCGPLSRASGRGGVRAPAATGSAGRRTLGETPHVASGEGERPSGAARLQATRRPAREGGRIRTRLVAFGRSAHCDLHTISHAHIVEAMAGFLSGLGEAFHPAQFSAAAPAMLNLLLKQGFRLAGQGE